MREERKYKLLEDVRSGKNELYGQKNDVVTLVVQNGNTLIVCDKNFNRWPVHIDKVKEL